MHVVIFTKSSPKARANARIAEELEFRGAKVSFCHPNRFALTVGDSPTLTYNGESFSRPDYVLTRTGTGVHAANILRHMEAIGFDVGNRIGPIQTAIDKARTILAASAARLPIPKSLILSGQDDVLGNWTDFPAVVKLPTGSCGRGVILVESESQLKALIQMVRAVDVKRNPILVQEYVRDRVGVDLRVFIIEGRIIGVMERSATVAGEWRANLAQGAVGRGLEVTPSIAEISLEIAKVIGLDIAGVDLLYRGDQYVICEVNSSPGMDIERHCKINVAAQIAEFVVNKVKAKAASAAEPAS
jgi:gamma-F420-2:alpha-L-glutamate ligase